MSENVKKCFDRLRFIASIKNPGLRKKILVSTHDDCLYFALNEIALNTIKGNMKLQTQQKKKLHKYKRLLKNLSLKTNNRVKRRKLVSQSGGFLPILIPTLASILTTLITN
jgi:hypothetical protein